MKESKFEKIRNWITWSLMWIVAAIMAVLFFTNPSAFEKIKEFLELII